MVPFLQVITLLTAIACLLYVLLIARYSYGWKRTPSFGEKLRTGVHVAVVIAARNEEENITQCLGALTKQDYDPAFYEIIVADDHSTDATAQLVKRFAEKYRNVKLISLSDPQITGKKKAIAAAIAVTQAELIVTTDADCVMEKDWLASIAAFYKETGSVMIVGPIAFIQPRSLFEKIQDVELMALAGSTAGSLYDHNATLCNGANLAYTRKVFNELDGFKDIDRKASGDDVLLMYKVAAKYPQQVRFLKCFDALVHTKAQSSLSGFISQRKRWASKGFGALNAATKRVSLLVFSFSFLLLFLLLFSGFAALKTGIGLPFLLVGLIIFAIKCIIDFLLLFLAASFTRRTSELFYFLPLQVIYIAYVAMIGMPWIARKQEWKGRKL